MKCQQCEKPATFHITELTGAEPQEIHLCEGCAQKYLMQTPGTGMPGKASLAGMLAQQLKVADTAKELEKLDEKCCPICGISFYEFRNQGRLGCPHDYVFFASELEPLIVNIHGDLVHKGKHPLTHKRSTESQTKLIQLRREMNEAIRLEQYERASELRDTIRNLEESEDQPGDEHSV
ncbi:UvrB/UvrC motif-containing protein [Blastopirellula sp. JC732]|uniref:UvrB/UvrC motif-containing protein n=1 Tax=Blastopirellula sediminis TaxID=2894196 RepID=A0A9X1MPW4_9BACT|nr:UvrB/UvrC motif-containing protein [Blastopirellula sediminis]MCC9605452.1 UvrB/UvrC motif-containing protein [Blastopirellula sediminis]MCC9631248.1 UvrB/UvrC motif-containing protein [Blastopirellula sediminis]